MVETSNNSGRNDGSTMMAKAKHRVVLFFGTKDLGLLKEMNWENLI